MLKIKKIENVEIDLKTFGIYGKNGTGKTTFAASLPGNKLYIDINEKGLNSIAHEDRKNISILEINTFEKFEEFLLILLDKNKFEEFEKENEIKFDTIIFDTISQLEDLFLNWADDNKNKFLSEKGKFDSFKVWKRATKLAKILMSSCKNLDLKTVFLFQQKDVFDDLGTFLNDGIRLTNPFGKVFKDELDFIAKTAIIDVKDKSEFALILENKINNDVKIRLPKNQTIKKGILNPDYEKLKNEIKGEK